MRLAKYGVAFTYPFPVPKVDDTDFAESGDWTPATNDIKVSKDFGDVANTTNLPIAIGGTGSRLWKHTLIAAEMQAAVIAVQIVDAAIENQAIEIYTYGHANAHIAMDFDDIVRAGLTALPNAAADAPGGLPISDAGGLDLDTALAVLTDAMAELTGSADAPATPTLTQAMMLLYMWLRNNTQDSETTRKILNDAGSTVLQATMSMVSGVFSHGELGDP